MWANGTKLLIGTVHLESRLQQHDTRTEQLGMANLVFDDFHGNLEDGYKQVGGVPPPTRIDALTGTPIGTCLI